MSDKELFEILNDIDDEIVEEVSEEMIFWQRSQKGISVKIDNSRKFSWKTVTAAVACAAAVMLGVFVLLLNIGKIDITDDPANSGAGSDNSSNVNDSSFGGTDSNSDVIGENSNVTLNQDITSAKCYRVDFLELTEDQVTSLFKAVPQREASTRFSGRVDFKAGEESGFLSPSSGVGRGTYYVAVYMTEQGDKYDTAAHKRYAEISENIDWDFLSRDDAEKKISDILSGFMPTGTSVRVYAVSADYYSEYVKKKTGEEDIFGEKVQKDWGTAADYYYFTIEQTVDGIPIQSELIGNINIGTQTWGSEASGVLSAEGLVYLRVFSPYKIIGEVETSEKFITFPEAEQMFKDKNDSFLTTEEITLEYSRLVYAVLRAEDNSLILTPVWEFKYNGEQFFRVNAYTGEEVVTV